MRNLEVWYTRFEIEKLMPSSARRSAARCASGSTRLVAKARRRDSVQAFSKLSHDVDGERRIVSDPPLIVRLDDLPDRRRARSRQGRRRAPAARVRLTLPPRAPDPARAVPARRPGPQGGRRRQRRYRRLGRAAARPGRARSAAPAGQGGAGLGAGGVRRRERVRERRRARRRGPADHAGLERHLPRLARRRRERRRRLARLLRPAAARLEGLASSSRRWTRGRSASTGSSARRRSPTPTRARATASRSPAYLGSGDVFDRAILAFSEAYAEQNDRDYASLLEAVEAGRVSAERSL